MMNSEDINSAIIDVGNLATLHHRISMRICEKADEYVKSGDAEHANRFFRLALKHELKAIDELPWSLRNSVCEYVLLKSASAIAENYGDIEESSRLNKLADEMEGR